MTDANVEGWLKQWSQLSALVDETHSWLQILTQRDTSNQSCQERRARFLDELFGPIQRADQQVKAHLLKSSLSPEGFAIPLQKLRVDSELFREENVALLNQENKLVEEYFRIHGAQNVLWDGQEVAITRLSPEMESLDRSRRERAWQTFSERKLQDREALNEIWVKLMHLRQQIAKHASFPSYGSYRWKQLCRFDYINGRV